jgi:pullulanase-type alpha-1,6-glucosidase
MKHLSALAAAGLTHLHLLPAFDIATVDEDPANRVDLDTTVSVACGKVTGIPAAVCSGQATKTLREALATLAGDSEDQQAIASAIHLVDSFNWGYDPLHYGVPEGSYASTAEGTARIVEFRQMVQALAQAGLRVVMDVVYNHTNASGVSPNSVLDKVVPGYYHRLDENSGSVLSSTCCSNTATEHAMMQRLMVDTLVRWARDYKVDGFRFDLMGHHLKQNIVDAKAALAALTPGADGVDGSKIILYGEGWDFGEVQNNARGTNATQRNMAGTGVGTFNDRIRDGVRGGSAFDSTGDIRKRQGFATGLYLDPNESSGTSVAERDTLDKYNTLVRIGMAGNLAAFRTFIAEGVAVDASAYGYGGAPAGYTAEPMEAINYVSAHDNQTFWDIAQYKLPTGTASLERSRIQIVALATAALGQGTPFFHMGDDLLRSKSMERDSYDSGDWFNRIDWTGATNAWRSGLPNAGKDSANWPWIKPIFMDATTTPSAGDIGQARARFQELLKIRKSTPLLHLGNSGAVTKRVDFPTGGATQVRGLLVMTVTDGTCAGADLDPARDAVVVLINADKVSASWPNSGATGFTLHPIDAASADPRARTATFTNGTFTVPPHSVAVFEKLQSGAQGAGLPCNSR